MPRTKSERLRAPFLIATVIALVIAGYSAYAVYPYLRGPLLILDAPVHDGVTVIRGQTVRVSAMTVDGLPVPLDERGFFSVERTYPPGYTVVTVRGVDRFGRSVTRTLTFVTKPYASKKIEDGSGTTSPQDSETNGSL
jgi:hypothetical protein